MPGKEEWVLVWLGSQHKCVEPPVWPVFPGYPFLVTMYVTIYKKNVNLIPFPQISQKSVKI